MNIFTRTTFASARVIMALAVFFCHVFPSINMLGPLFVGVFFFMSGYGMEFNRYRAQSLYRVIPYILVFAAYSLVYYLLFRVWIYPSSWFLVMYFFVMLLYRFISDFRLLVIVFLLLGLLLPRFGFELAWVASVGSFLYGVWFSRYPYRFTFVSCLKFLPLMVLFFFHVDIFFWGILPLFSLIVLHLSSRLSFISFLGRYTFHFYCSHCLFLGLLGATWTLGGSPIVPMVVFGFFLTCVFSYVMKEGIIKW